MINSSVPEQAQIVEVWLESIMDDPITQANGLSTIIDLNGYSWRLFKWVTPTNIKMVAKRVDTYPVKELLLHIVNTSFLLSATLKLIWPFLNDRLKNMVSFWANFNNYLFLFYIRYLFTI